MRIVILHIYPCVYYYILLCNKVKYIKINTILFGSYQSFLYLCNMIRKDTYHNININNNLIHTIMTLSEFKNLLAPLMAKEYNGAIDLLFYWDGYSLITPTCTDGYNCSLGDIIDSLSDMGFGDVVWDTEGIFLLLD